MSFVKSPSLPNLLMHNKYVTLLSSFCQGHRFIKTPSRNFHIFSFKYPCQPFMYPDLPEDLFGSPSSESGPAGQPAIVPPTKGTRIARRIAPAVVLTSDDEDSDIATHSEDQTGKGKTVPTNYFNVGRPFDQRAIDYLETGANDIHNDRVLLAGSADAVTALPDDEAAALAAMVRLVDYIVVFAASERSIRHLKFCGGIPPLKLVIEWTGEPALRLWKSHGLAGFYAASSKDLLSLGSKVHPSQRRVCKTFLRERRDEIIRLNLTSAIPEGDSCLDDSSSDGGPSFRARKAQKETNALLGLCGSKAHWIAISHLRPTGHCAGLGNHLQQDRDRLSESSGRKPGRPRLAHRGCSQESMPLGNKNRFCKRQPKSEQVAETPCLGLSSKPARRYNSESPSSNSNRKGKKLCLSTPRSSKDRRPCASVVGQKLMGISKRRSHKGIL